MKPDAKMTGMKWVAPALLLFLASGTQSQTHWEKHPAGPVFSGNPGSWNHHVSQPCVIRENGIYKMWYTAKDPNNSESIIAYTQSEDGIHWPARDVPDLNGVTDGYWDRYKCNARVIRVQDTLKMWYTGYYYDLFRPVARIGYAWSVKGNAWNFHPKPVLEKGKHGIFDDRYVFCPSVIHDGKIYHMWYSARSLSDEFNIGHATSSDGIHWEKDEENSPVIRSIGKYGWYCRGIQQPHVILVGDTLHMWFGASGYEWERTIGHAVSADWTNWVLDGEAVPVLEPGHQVDWDSQQAGCPYVIIDEGRYKMWYSGSNTRENRWMIGLALGDLVKEPPPGDNVGSSHAMSASPNPFTGDLIVTCNFLENTSYSMDVFALTGQHVLKLEDGTIGRGNYYSHCNLADLPSGIYFLVLKTTGSTIRQKIIKQ